MENIKINKLLFIFIFVFINFITLNVYAIEECSTSKMERLKELAQNISFKTSYEVDDVDNEFKSIHTSYSVQIMNFNEDLSIHYTSFLDSEEKIVKSDTTTISNLDAGDKITFKIYSYTTDLCTDEILKTVTLDLPKLNSYYYFNQEKCDKNPEFKYCTKFMDTDLIDFDAADEEFEEYLKPSISKVFDNPNNKVFLYIGISVGVLVIGTVVFLIIKKRKKDDL